MEYALLFTLMGTWMLYREVSYWKIRTVHKRATTVLALLMMEKLGKDSGMIKIEVMKGEANES